MLRPNLRRGNRNRPRPKTPRRRKRSRQRTHRPRKAGNLRRKRRRKNLQNTRRKSRRPSKAKAPGSRAGLSSTTKGRRSRSPAGGNYTRRARKRSARRKSNGQSGLKTKANSSCSRTWGRRSISPCSRKRRLPGGTSPRRRQGSRRSRTR